MNSKKQLFKKAFLKPIAEKLKEENPRFTPEHSLDDMIEDLPRMNRKQAKRMKKDSGEEVLKALLCLYDGDIQAGAEYFYFQGLDYFQGQTLYERCEAGKQEEVATFLWRIEYGIPL